MSTHAIIAKVDRREGRPLTTAIGVHNDGYPGATGWLLHHYYRNEADIDRLLSNDCLSRLGVSPEAQPCEASLHGLHTIASPARQPRYRQTGDIERMMDNDWIRSVNPSWIYVREGGQWLVRQRGSDHQLSLEQVLADYDEPVMWSFAEPDGAIQYRDREWVLANILPPA